MILAIIGGGGVRTPLLINGLFSGTSVPPDEVRLFDTDKERLRLIGRVVSAVVAHHGNRSKLVYTDNPEVAFDGADFVFSSFRQGSEAARVHDESVPLSLGILGQETVGAGGWSMAMRTIPQALSYADTLHRYSPDAWLINFTNPSGIVTEALYRFSSHQRTIGICDAPVVIGRMAAQALGLPYESVAIKYFGLNHLGWAYSVMVDGVERIEEIIRFHLKEFIAAEPFYTALENHIQETGLLPNEYLLYYLNTAKVLQSYKDSGNSRGAFILESSKDLFKRLSDTSADPVQAYEEYLTIREGSYMTKESGLARPVSQKKLFSGKKSFGYDDIALGIMNAISTDAELSLPVIIRNGDYCPYLEADDSIEVTCNIGAAGPRVAYPAPTYPESCEKLIRLVKSYERLTAKAALGNNEQVARLSLGANPSLRAPILMN
ncbi:6-phospho-beta-glucosidase [Treponema sp.]